MLRCALEMHKLLLLLLLLLLLYIANCVCKSMINKRGYLWCIVVLLPQKRFLSDFELI